MYKIKDLKNQFINEISQKQEFQRRLLLQLLTSKRLLKDHLESLEEVVTLLFNSENILSSNHLTLLSTTSTLISSYALFQCLNHNARYMIPCIVGTMPLMYLHKTANWKQLVSCENILNDFIKSLDDFEFYMKKITNVLNDAQYIKPQADIFKRFNQEKNLPVDIMKLTKRIIGSLFCTLKWLEFRFKIDEKFKYFYQDIEDIDNCNLMVDKTEEITTNKLKEIFSLFAYVQSYLLLRIGTIFASNPNDGKFILKKHISDITKKVKYQTSLLPNFLLAQQEEKDLRENIQKLIDDKLGHSASNEVPQIRSMTVDFSLKILSLITQFKHFQQIIIDTTFNCEEARNKKELNKALDCLDNIGLQISECSDEQSRFLILLSKHLKKEIDTVESLKIDDVEQNVTKPSITLVEQDDILTPRGDDFFYVESNQDDINECCQNKNKLDINEDLEEEAIQKNKTRKCFLPVLAQLRERIVDIDLDMKEREKKVLMEKGIEIKEKKDVINCDNMNNDKNMPARGQMKYDMQRQFLQEKNQVNLFAKDITKIFPMKNEFIGLQEEILE